MGSRVDGSNYSSGFYGIWCGTRLPSQVPFLEAARNHYGELQNFCRLESGASLQQRRATLRSMTGHQGLGDGRGIGFQEIVSILHEEWCTFSKRTLWERYRVQVRRGAGIIQIQKSWCNERAVKTVDGVWFCWYPEEKYRVLEWLSVSPRSSMWF
jgi:hypothetical protein